MGKERNQGRRLKENQRTTAFITVCICNRALGIHVQAMKKKSVVAALVAMHFHRWPVMSSTTKLLLRKRLCSLELALSNT